MVSSSHNSLKRISYKILKSVYFLEYVPLREEHAIENLHNWRRSRSRLQLQSFSLQYKKERSPNTIFIVLTHVPIPTSNTRSHAHFSRTPSLYVADLHRDVTETDFVDAFQAQSLIHNEKVCRDLVIRRSSEYGYVNYKSLVDGEHTLSTMNYYACRRRREIYCDSYGSCATRRCIDSVMVTCLSRASVRRLIAGMYGTFTQFGKILSCKLATTDDSKSLEDVFLSFESVSDADETIGKVNGRELAGKIMFVGTFKTHHEREARTSHVNRAQKRTERTLHLQQAHDRTRKKLQAKRAGKNLYFKNLSRHSMRSNLKNISDILEPLLCVSLCVMRKFHRNDSNSCATPDQMRRRTHSHRTYPLSARKSCFLALLQKKEERQARIMRQ